MIKGTVAKDLFLSRSATCTPRREVQSCLSRTWEVVCAFAEGGLNELWNFGFFGLESTLVGFWA
jgi:hypothetical protein